MSTFHAATKSTNSLLYFFEEKNAQAKHVSPLATNKQAHRQHLHMDTHMHMDTHTDRQAHYVQGFSMTSFNRNIFLTEIVIDEAAQVIESGDLLFATAAKVWMESRKMQEVCEYV